MNEHSSAPRRARFFRRLCGLLCLLALLGLGASALSAGEASAKRKAPAKSSRQKKSSKPQPQEAVKAAEEPVADQPANPYALPPKATRAEVQALFETGLGEARAERYETLSQIAAALLAAPGAKAQWPAAKVWQGYALYKLARYEEAAKALRRAKGALGELDAALGLLAAKSSASAKDTAQAAILYASLCRQKEKPSPLELALYDEDPAAREACLLKIRLTLDEKTAAAIGLELGAKLKAWETAPEEKPACAEDYQYLALRAKALRGNTEAETAFLGDMISPAPSCVFGREMQARREELARAGTLADPPTFDAGLYRVKALLGELYHEEALALADRLLARAEAAESASAPELLYQKARALFAVQRYEEALALYRGLIPRFANDAKRAQDSLQGAARTLARLNRLDEAAAAYGALAAQTSDKKLALSARFLSSWLLGFSPQTRPQAVLGLDAFATANPRQNQGRQARWFAAFFTYLSGPGDETMSRLESIARDKDLPAWHDAARYFMARALEKLGRLREARSYYVFLAGAPSYTYYRLLAGERLRLMADSPKIPSVTPAAKNEEPAQRSEMQDAPLQTGLVNDAEVNGKINERLANWLRDEKRDKAPALNEEERFSASLIEAQASLRKIGQDDERERERLFASVKKEWEPLFPALARARAWQRLGLENEAQSALLLFWGQVDRYLHRRGNKAPEGKSPLSEARKTLFSERAALVKKAPPGFYVELLLWAAALNNSALAFQIKPHLMDGKSREKLAAKLFVGGFKLPPAAEAPPAGAEAEDADDKAMEELGPSNDKSRWLLYPPAYADTISRYAREVKLPVSLALAIMRIESAYRSDAVSPMQAVGLLQIMPHTADRLAALLALPDFSRKELFAPSTNLRFGTYYLSRLIDTFHGQWPLAIGSYNAGPFNLRTWMERSGPLPLDEFIETFEFVQTRDYVKKALTAQATYKALYGGRFTSCPLAVPLNPAPNPDGVAF